MQLKDSYYIATNVCSRKSVTTFGDLPDWLYNVRMHTLILVYTNRIKYFCLSNAHGRYFDYEF